MKKLILLFAAFVLFAQFNAKADEGMWLLTMLKKNYSDMKKQGFKLTPEDIYNLNKPSIKDAIVQFGLGRGFCTGEIISDKGLLLTNHHCGYPTIQMHSTVEHDYLTNGFWAKTIKDELPTPHQMVKFLESIEDVTKAVTKGLKDGMSEEERQKAIEKLTKKMEEKIMKGKNEKVYEARVRSFFGGNQYFLLVYKVYRDVRFVGAPPQSIGKYGHDTDNWVWPRHTGDFSIFRVYMSKDGEPTSEYVEDNVPLKPKHHLPVSLKGVNKGDFAMVLGYPGGTQRYMTSWEVDEVNSITHPNRIKIRGVKQEIWMKDMKADSKVNIQYSSKFAGSSNYWKFSIGQKKGLERLKIADKKRDLESKFTAWVNENEARKKEYGEALSLIEKAVKGRGESSHITQYLSECFLRGVEITGMAGRAGKLAKLLGDDKAKKEDIDAAVKALKEGAEGFYKDYNMPTDMKVTEAMVKTYGKSINEKLHPDFYAKVKEIGNCKNYADEVFKTSVFTSKEKLEKFLENPTAKVIEEDMAYKMYTSARKLFDEMRAKSAGLESDFDRGHRLFVKGLMEMQPEKNFYPDANFTMRMTYGTVGDYKPSDAVHYDYITTMDGVMEKFVPGDYEFDLPKELVDVYNKKDYGIYAIDPSKLEGSAKAEHIAKFGNKIVMPVCFTSNNDITGGNSGSPVLGSKGELIGLAFDGNWEAMSGDIAFEDELQKCINVDIRYVLFVIDKVGGAKHLVDEMDIVK